ncbi:MAG TPA: hypothetical protein P5210_05990, partial [Draconibacterium sp.]|nr:hypothetical protein [Draconibacterium sp.]
GIIMLKMEGEKITEISVSDPNRELRRFNFSISTKIQMQSENYSAVWSELNDFSEITIGLPYGNFAGQSVTIKL